MHACQFTSKIFSKSKSKSPTSDSPKSRDSSAASSMKTTTPEDSTSPSQPTPLGRSMSNRTPSKAALKAREAGIAPTISIKRSPDRDEHGHPVGAGPATASAVLATASVAADTAAVPESPLRRTPSDSLGPTPPSARSPRSVSPLPHGGAAIPETQPSPLGQGATSPRSAALLVGHHENHTGAIAEALARQQSVGLRARSSSMSSPTARMAQTHAAAMSAGGLPPSLPHGSVSMRDLTRGDNNEPLVLDAEKGMSAASTRTSSSSAIGNREDGALSPIGGSRAESRGGSPGDVGALPPRTTTLKYSRSVSNHDRSRVRGTGGHCKGSLQVAKLTNGLAGWFCSGMCR